LAQNQTVVSVLGIDPFRIGGGETFARELSRQLGMLGWRSVLCYLNPPAGKVREFLELPNVDLEVLPDAWRPGWRQACGLVAILRRHRPEILHLHFSSFLGPYPWTAKLLGVPRIFFTDHSSRPEGYQPRRARLWKRLATRAINSPIERVTCPSDYGVRCWEELGVLPPARFVRIYNGVDLTRPAGDATAFRRRWSIPGDRLVVLQVSWIIPEKGIGDLLEAARRVVQQEPRAHFVVAGEGAARAQFTEGAARMGLERHVTWTGLLLDPWAEGAYAAADVVCQVSRWEEIFGWSIAEAMAAGRPVVGTRVGGIPEVIEHGRSGLLVPRGDVSAIASGILSLLPDAALRESMGEAGRAIAKGKFDLARNVGELLRLYGLGSGIDRGC
jgi:glycosyltransferase involved in cell wall biosynthesis